MKMKQLLIVALAMVLVASISVVATIAYFTDSDTVTNTFSVGKVKITMDEANVDLDLPDGADTESGAPNATPAPRDHENDYHLLPGQEYDKDPTVHVEANSEDCFIYVKVENGLYNIQQGAEFTVKDNDGKDVIVTRTVEQQIEAKGWKLLEGQTNVWYREHTKNDEQVDYTVFEKFAIKDEATNDSIAQYASEEIKVTAYAIQKAGFEGKPVDAWEAYNDQND